MVMGAYESGQDDLSGTIDGLRARETLLQVCGVPNGGDGFAICDDRAIPDYLIVWAQGYDNPILKSYCHL
jgi:hypothetical protein